MLDLQSSLVAERESWLRLHASLATEREDRGAAETSLESEREARVTAETSSQQDSENELDHQRASVQEFRLKQGNGQRTVYSLDSTASLSPKSYKQYHNPISTAHPSTHQRLD